MTKTQQRYRLEINQQTVPHQQRGAKRKLIKQIEIIIPFLIEITFFLSNIVQSIEIVTLNVEMAYFSDDR